MGNTLGKATSFVSGALIRSSGRMPEGVSFEHETSGLETAETSRDVSVGRDFATGVEVSCDQRKEMQNCKA